MRMSALSPPPKNRLFLIKTTYFALVLFASLSMVLLIMDTKELTSSNNSAHLSPIQVPDYEQDYLKSNKRSLLRFTQFPEDLYYPLQKEEEQNLTLHRALTRAEFWSLMNVTEWFCNTLGRANIDFFIVGGSLLGSLRHHSVVPWDDDVDLALNIKDKQRVLKLLSEQERSADVPFRKSLVNYGSNDTEIIKLYDGRLPKAPRQEWSFPFLDVFFYRVNESSGLLQELINWNLHRNLRLELKHVFPLELRPFAKFWLPSPRNPVRYLQLELITDFYERCMRGTWSHREERRLTTNKTMYPCAELAKVYPFARRKYGGDGSIIESVEINKKPVYNVTFQKR